jgi:L-ascorbate metabolism protein UlaG (beta-lactamase superfamily)
MTVRFDDTEVTWLGYACARVAGADGTVVYTDPGRYGTMDGTWNEQYGLAGHPDGRDYRPEDADLVLVTHDHHYDDDGVRRVSNDDTVVVCYEGVSAGGVMENSGREVVEPEALPYDVRRIGYGEDLTAAGVDVRAVPAYNEPDGPRQRADGSVYHPRGLGCGFRFVVGGRACFWTGDSDAVPEQEGLDVSLFLPTIAKSYTMTREEAAELAGALDPDLVVPIHYNTFEALGSDSAAFAADVAKRAIPLALDEDGLDG